MGSFVHLKFFIGARSRDFLGLKIDVANWLNLLNSNKKCTSLEYRGVNPLFSFLLISTNDLISYEFDGGITLCRFFPTYRSVFLPYPNPKYRTNIPAFLVEVVFGIL